MRAAIYARVSTPRQARAQNIDEQVERLKAYAEQKGFGLEEEHVYLDEGYSGASLNRPGLDTLRDAPAGCGGDGRVRGAVGYRAGQAGAQVRPPSAAPRGIAGARLSGRVHGEADEPGSQRPTLAADKRSGGRVRKDADRREDAPREACQTARRTIIADNYCRG